MQVLNNVSFDERIELIQALRADNMVTPDHAMELLTTWTDQQWAEFKADWDRQYDDSWNPEQQAA